MNIEAEVRDFAEVPHQHLAEARQPEPLAVAGDIFIDELSEVRPILLVEAGDVGSVNVGEDGVGHGDRSVALKKPGEVSFRN